MKYIIPDVPPSLNKFAGRKNVWQYREAKTLWKNLCVLYCRPRPGYAPEKARVNITFYFKTRARHDADNYQKLLLDGLSVAGVIKDDDFEHVEVLCKGGYDKENPRTEIEVMVI